MAESRILTTHAGSLPRPEAVLRQVQQHEAGERSAEPTEEALLANAVASCVDRQIAAGVDIPSDGELGKPGYSTYVKDRLSGFAGHGAFPAPADLAAYPTYAPRIFGDRALQALRTPACTGPIAYRDTVAVLQDIDRFRRALRGRAAGFMTAASPGVIALFLQNRHYATRDAYLAALADAMRTEYEAIHDAGFLLQIDCPDLAMAAHTELAGRPLAEVRAALERNVEALNRAVARIPPEAMRIHVCWGNYEGPHHLDAELEDVIDIVLAARPSGISFAAANPRHEHEWKVWARTRIPDGKVLVPGVIDTTTNFVEHPELVAERIERFVDVVGEERVIAGTDCGFATFAGVHTVDPEIAWAKLSALAEGAALATRDTRHPSRRSWPVMHA